MNKTAAPRFAFSSDSPEWYTPEYILDGVRYVFGCGIYLDPASSAVANETVRARRYYSYIDRGEDSLHLPWRGRTIFLNPPYGRRTAKHGAPAPHGSNQRLFLHRLLVEARYEQAAFLSNAGIGDAWYVQVMRRAPAVCLFDRRVHFDMPESAEVKKQPTKGHSLAYYGEHIDRFVSYFNQYGCVVTN